MSWSPNPSLRGTLKLGSSGSNSLLGPQPLKPNPSGVLLVRNAKDKGVASETPKLQSRVQFFNCQGFGHVTSNCANNTLVIDRKESASEEEGIEKPIYKPNLDEFEDLDDDCLGNPNHLACIRATSF